MDLNQSKNLQPFYRPVTWVVLVIALAVVLLIQVYPLTPERRVWLIIISASAVLVALLSLRFLIPRTLNRNIFIYGGITFHTAAIATVEFLFGSLDLSPIYFMRILASAMLWDYRAALYSALLASIFQPLATVLLGINLTDRFAIVALKDGSYFAAAFLISEFAKALTTRWRASVEIAEKQRQEISQRKIELELVYEIAQLMGHGEDAASILRDLTARVAMVLNAQVCLVMRLDLVNALIHGMAPGFGLADKDIAAISYRVTRQVLDVWDMTQRQYFFSNDLSHLPPQLNQFAQRFNARQVVCAAMMTRGEPVGYILAANRRDGSPFNESDARLLAILAEQAVTIVENARTLTHLQTNLDNAARLYSMSTELIARLEPGQIPQRVVMSIAEALHAPIATIALWDETTRQMRYAATIGISEEVKLIPFRENGLGMSVLNSGNARFIEDLQREPNPSPARQLLKSRAVACLPIRHGEKRFGVLFVNFIETHTFTEAEKNLLATFAHQTAIALDNAQLYTREQQRATELDLIAELGRQITSILNLDELLPTLVQLVHDRFGYRYVHLFINDPIKRITALRALVSTVAGVQEPAPYFLPFGQGMIGWVAEHGRTLLANDVTQEPRHIVHPDVADTRSELCVPIQIGNRVIGVLDVQSEHLNAFEKNSVTIFEALASQIAVAIENARLYGELQDQARRDSLTQVFNHGYFIEQLNERVETAQRKERPLALIMLDIDRYKEYNDRYGHVVGDHVLTEIVQAIRANIKFQDILGRWGGEEFGIALPNADTPRAMRVAERIRATILAAKLTDKSGNLIPPPTVSQGIAAIPKFAVDAATLIDLADAALYRAKARGRDQIEIAHLKK